ncbi:MAG: DUF4097 family beta strand repeat-containing protein [Nonlabens sp.]|uniref:DUF4097 family beta strand repeat-containing protein n=1 Tax=Nonlabens sp. TaxID=1888209 RepID=UPI003EF882F0
MAKSHWFSIVYRSFFMSCILMLFAFAKAYSQRNSSDIIYSNAHVKVVDITLESTIELEIRTTTSQEIRISGSQGGEYKDAILLSSKVVNDTLEITDPFNPNFHFPQDKLSAHKIIDGKATLYLPAGLELRITARSSYLTISGQFKKMFVNIQSGDCKLNAIQGDFHIISVHADVHVSKSTSTIEMHSKYGAIQKNNSHKNQLYLQKIETINGDITIED